MQGTKNKIVPILIVVGLLAMAGVFGKVMPGGESTQQSPNRGGSKDYFPQDGERSFNVAIGAESHPNLGLLDLSINGTSEKFKLEPKGGGIFYRSSEMRAGTTIVVKVFRTGEAGSKQHTGEIGCLIKENGRVVSGGTMNNDPAVNSILCVWVVGQEG